MAGVAASPAQLGCPRPGGAAPPRLVLSPPTCRPPSAGGQQCRTRIEVAGTGQRSARPQTLSSPVSLLSLSGVGRLSLSPTKKKNATHLQQLRRARAEAVRFAQVERAKVGVERFVQLGGGSEGGGGRGVDGKKREPSGALMRGRARLVRSLASHQLVVDRVHDVLPRKRAGRKGGAIGDGGQTEAAGNDVDDLSERGRQNW